MSERPSLVTLGVFRRTPKTNSIPPRTPLPPYPLVTTILTKE